MSMDRCQYCGKAYDQDFDVEHEEECYSNPKNSDEKPIKIKKVRTSTWTMRGVTVSDIDGDVTITNPHGLSLGFSEVRADDLYDLLGKMITQRAKKWDY